MAEANKKTIALRNIRFTQILRYRLPLAGMTSILHRLSGALLFFLLPFSLYLFEQSLLSEISFAVLKGFVSHPFVKLIILLIVGAFSFHFLAGVRHLLMDAHWAVTKQGGKNTAAVVWLLSLLIMLAVAFKLFGVF